MTANAAHPFLSSPDSDFIFYFLFFGPPITGNWRGGSRGTGGE